MAREMAAPTGLPAPPSPAHTSMTSEAFSANTKDEISIRKWILHLSPVIPHKAAHLTNSLPPSTFSMKQGEHMEGGKVCRERPWRSEAKRKV